MVRDDEQVRAHRARDVGLFRYGLIRPLADPKLTSKQRGILVRQIAEMEHIGPDGGPCMVSRTSLDRWRRAWLDGGFDALVPEARQVQPRTPSSVLALAVALKTEVPMRTAAQVRTILIESGQVPPSERTLQRLFIREGIAAPGQVREVFGRFEAPEANMRWTGDAMHGPLIGGKKAILFAFIDDHTRVLVGYRWVRREDTIRVEAALRGAVAARGIPESVYVDNGSAFIDGQFHRALAVLGIRAIHSKPNRPQGKAKIERFFRTVRDQFLVELHAGNDLEDMDELNRLFTAWVEQVYHQREHSETQQAPLARWSASWQRQPQGPRLADARLLREAFLWSVHRMVTKTATVPLDGNIYEVDPALIGRKVELVFDPFHLADIHVRHGGKDFGPAVPHVIRAHVHKKARPDETTMTPVLTGIDYLGMVKARHEAALTERITYSRPPTVPGSGVAGDGQLPGQGVIDDFLHDAADHGDSQMVQVAA